MEANLISISVSISSLFVSAPSQDMSLILLPEPPPTSETHHCQNKLSLRMHEFLCEGKGHEMVTLLLWLWQLVHVPPFEDLA